MIKDHILFHNVAELEESKKGYIMWRLPRNIREQINDGARNETSCYGTGVELRFKIKGDVATLILAAEEGSEANVAYIFYGSIQGGWQNSSKVILDQSTRISIPKPENLEFLKELSKKNTLPFSPEVVRVVIPYGKVYYVGIEGEVELPEKEELPAKTYLAYGSSITHGSLALAMPYSYPFRIAQRLGCDYLNFGFAGTAQMEKAMAEYIASLKNWDFATVEMGINMVGEQFQTEVFEKNVDVFTAILSKDVRPVFATSIYGFSDPGFQKRGMDFRCIVEKYAKERLIYVDGLKLLNHPAYISQDMIHPSLEGMEEIVNNWCKVIQNFSRT